MAKALFNSSPLFSSSSAEISLTPAKASIIFGTQLRYLEMEPTHLRFPDSFKNPTLRLNALMESPAVTSEIMDKSAAVTDNALNQFKELRNRFLGFKKEKYLQNLEHYQILSQNHAPTFMVIACADSRVCPITILGFEPGEAFVVRNVANLVPPHENGPSETNAALEFAVNSLEVEIILVVGHSCCGGIKALMSFQDEIHSNSSSFIKNWVIVGKTAKLKTKAAASNLDFDQQCRLCEKESVNRSLSNLLSYPWIEERVAFYSWWLL